MKFSRPKDPLLLAAWGIVIFACVAIIFAMVMVGIGAITIVTGARSAMLAELAKVGAPPQAVWLIFMVMLMIIALLYLALRFARELLGIIDSVGEGDPFHPENGARLSRMGWIALGGQGLGLVLAAIVVWLKPFIEKAGDTVEMNFSADFGGLLLVLILFILARVFRHGAAMREELEGTV